MESTYFAEFLGFLISDEFFSVLALIAVWGFFISGLDDMFIDFRYMFNRLFRNKPENRLKMTEVVKVAEKPIAIMVPAWQEASVIYGMLMRNVTNIDYLNYHIFVGTYPNDPDTQTEVNKAIRYFQRIREGLSEEARGRFRGDFIHRVVTPRPGPTNKADNLNAVYGYIKEIEHNLVREGRVTAPFEIYVMHDCEDVIHPKELKLFNYLMTNSRVKTKIPGEPRKERYDFVQTPVFPLEVDIKPDAQVVAPLKESLDRLRWWNPITWIIEIPISIFEAIRVSYKTLDNLMRYAVSATYMEEFAEHHTKDMIVRREIRGLVPSAGVGTGINQIYLEKLEELNPKKGIFNDVHLTEDYEISLQLKNLGAKQFFVVEPVTMLKYKEGKMDKTQEIDEFIATKEYFPDTVMSSIKQKARWIMGITYQTMFPGKEKSLLKDFAKGWEGNFVTKYTLVRDRKALVTNYINIIGYAVFIYCIVKLMMVALIDYNWSYSRIFPSESYVWWLVFFDTVIMVERFLQKFHAVQKVYGIKHAFYFILRTFMLIGLFLANIINFFATLSATKRYLGYVFRKYVLPKKEKKKKKVTIQNGKRVTHVVNQQIPAWGKTDHNYLTEEQMREYVNRIGELALRARLIKPEQLEEALEIQKRDNLKLGDVLKNMGLIDEVGFSLLYAQQLSMSVQELDPLEIDRDVLYLVPEDLAMEYHLMPVAIDHNGDLVVATAEPLTDADIKLLESQLGRNLRMVITYQSDLEFSRKRAYGQIAGQPTSPLPKLGFWLMERNAIDENQLSEALYQQKLKKQPLGEILLGMGAIEDSHLDEYFKTSLGIGFKRINTTDIDIEFLESFPKVFCRIHRTVPVKNNKTEMVFGVANLGWRGMQEQLENHFEKEIKLFIAPESDILEAVEEGYSKVDADVVRGQLLGNRLIKAGAISENTLQRALEKQKETRRRLGEVLIEYGFCEENYFLRVYSEELYLSFVRLRNFTIDPYLGEIYPYSDAEARTIVPVSKQQNTLTFALPYDFMEEDIRSIEERYPTMHLSYVMVKKDEIRDAVQRLYLGEL